MLDLPECPVSTTALLIGDHWKILIIRELLSGTKRFSELKRELEGISNKVLSQHLKMMEKRGLIIKSVYKGVPLKTDYALTDIGWGLESLINEMWIWGSSYKNHIISNKKNI